MFIDKVAEIAIEHDCVVVSLAQPYKYDGMVEKVTIPYMSSKNYRTRKFEDGSKESEMWMLMELTEMSEREIDLMHISDLAVCIGVIRGFFLQFQTTSEIYYAQSTRLTLERLQQSLTE